MFCQAFQFCKLWVCQREGSTSWVLGMTLCSAHALIMSSYSVSIMTSLKVVIILDYNSHLVLHQSCPVPEFPGCGCTLWLLPAADRFSCWAQRWCCAAPWSAPRSAALFAPAHPRALSSGGTAHTAAEKQGNRKGLMDNCREIGYKAGVHSTVVFLLTKPAREKDRHKTLTGTSR